jgi:hypothetical protein
MEGLVTAPDPFPRSGRPLGATPVVFVPGDRAGAAWRAHAVLERNTRTQTPTPWRGPRPRASRSIWIVRDLFRRTLAGAATSKSARRSTA